MSTQRLVREGQPYSKKPKVETIQCPSVGEWIDKRWHSHTCVEVTPKEEIKGRVEPMDSHTIQQ